MRRVIGPLLLGAWVFACSSGSEGGGDKGGGAAGESTSTGGSAGSSSAGNGQAGSKAGSTSGGSQTGGSATGGSAGAHAGAGGMLMCPPCVAPPAPDCVGSGPCGCGPYTCPTGGAGGGEGEECGPVTCQPPLECCNPLMGTCVMPGMVCAQ